MIEQVENIQKTLDQEKAAGPGVWFKAHEEKPIHAFRVNSSLGGIDAGDVVWRQGIESVHASKVYFEQRFSRCLSNGDSIVDMNRTLEFQAIALMAMNDKIRAELAKLITGDGWLKNIIYWKKRRNSGKTLRKSCEEITQHLEDLKVLRKNFSNS